MEFTGRGAQIYTCERNQTAFNWVLKGPDALLYDATGKVVARHFFGPRWQAKDGSEIRGILVLANISPEMSRHDAPWLLLHAVIERGNGLFSQVDTIMRTDTRGGNAPVTTCDAETQSESVAVPYMAKYTFFLKPEMVHK